MREDRRQVAIAEPAGVRGDDQCLVDGLRSVQLGQRGRLGELAAQLCRAGRRCRLQPPLRPGRGKLTSPLRGSMAIERIEPVDVEQSSLFTSAPVDEELLARQGIDAPQGLAALSDPQWYDETDDAYLAALLSK